MKRCPNCHRTGSLHTSQAVFCYQCGTRLVEMEYEHGCGFHLLGSESFCPGCGVRLSHEDHYTIVESVQ